MANYRILMSSWLSLAAGAAACGNHVIVGGDPTVDSGNPTNGGAGGTSGGSGAGNSGSGGTGGSGDTTGSGGASDAAGGATGGGGATGTGGGAAGSGGASGAAGGSNGGAGRGRDASGSGGSSGGSGSTDAGGSGGTWDGGDDGGRIPNPKDGGACYAACGTPAGTVAKFASAKEVYDSLAGRWFFCPGGGRVYVAPADTVGVEYGPVGAKGGNMYYLVWGSSGLERGAGFDYQLTYDVSEWIDGNGNIAFQLNHHPAPNSGFGTIFRYSPCPVQWQMSHDTQGKVILLPID
jgi:hypothetical protein